MPYREGTTMKATGCFVHTFSGAYTDGGCSGLWSLRRQALPPRGNRGA